jgi:hypothetical protein
VGRGRGALSKPNNTWGVWPAQHTEGGETYDVREADSHPKRVVHSYMITDNNVNCEYTAWWLTTDTSLTTKISLISLRGCWAGSSLSPCAIHLT